MRGSAGRVLRWARSPSGQRAIRRATEYARSPEGKRKIAQARERAETVRRRRIERKGRRPPS